MKKIALCLMYLLFVSIISFAQNTQKIALKKGQKFVQQISGNVVISQQVMGQSIDSKIDMASVNTIEVKDIKDTGYSLAYTITKLKMNMSAMGQDMNYDSDKKDNDSTMGKGMSKLLNNPKNIDIDLMGKVTNNTKDTNDTNSDGDMMTGLQNMLGNPDAFLVIPSKAKVGYSWSDSVNKDDTKSNTTYTIKELKGNDATVSVKGTMQVSQKAQTQNMEFTSNSTGSFKGDLIVDIKTGIVKQRNSSVETTGTVDIMGQQIPMTTKVSSESFVKSMQ